MPRTRTIAATSALDSTADAVGLGGGGGWEDRSARRAGPWSMLLLFGSRCCSGTASTPQRFWHEDDRSPKEEIQGCRGLGRQIRSGRAKPNAGGGGMMGGV
jgi:hypothetical protein